MNGCADDQHENLLVSISSCCKGDFQFFHRFLKFVILQKKKRNEWILTDLQFRHIYFYLERKLESLVWIYTKEDVYLMSSLELCYCAEYYNHTGEICTLHLQLWPAPQVIGQSTINTQLFTYLSLQSSHF